MENRSNRLTRGVGLAAVALALGVADQAVAQEQDNSGVDEIVVTAQRREQNLQDVGVSVTALSAERLEELGVMSSMDIPRAVPGVLLQNAFGGGGSNANLTIRGVAQTDTSPNQEPPNSIYIDEVFLSSPAMASFGTYDLERVEVLRGPQGTLFGRASSGGLASFISRRPDDEWGGYVELGGGDFNSRHVEAAFGGPLSDAVRFRLAGRAERSDGWMINTEPGGEDVFENNFNGVRGQLEADLSSNLTARLMVTYEEVPRGPMGGYASVATTPGPGGASLPNGGTDFTGYTDTDSRFNAVGFNSGGFIEKDRFAPTLYLNYDMGEATLTSITNYTDFNFNYSEDPDGTPNDIFGNPGDLALFDYSQDLQQFSQEVRLNGERGALQYTAGFYYLNVEQDIRQFFSGYFGLSPGEFGILNPATQELESWALFGQLEYELSPTLSATLGLRYTDETKTFSSQAFDTVGGGPAFYDFSEATVGSAATSEEGLWSGKFQLDYRPNDDTLLYASVSRGVKGAGFNTNINGAATLTDTAFDSESVWAYEVGAKLDLIDNRLRINGSAFYYDFTDYQAYTFISTAGLVRSTDGRFSGAELEISAAPTDSLDLNLGVAYLDTILYDVPGHFYAGVRDNEAAQAPRWTVNGSVTQRFNLPIGTLAVNWNGNYIDDRFASSDNAFGSFLDGSFVHNARVSLEMEQHGLEIAAFVNNIANEDRLVFSTDTGIFFGNWLQIYAPPRWAGVTIRKTF